MLMQLNDFFLHTKAIYYYYYHHYLSIEYLFKIYIFINFINKDQFFNPKVRTQIHAVIILGGRGIQGCICINQFVGPSW